MTTFERAEYNMFGLRRSDKALASALLVVAALASNAGAPLAQDDDESAEEVFREHVSGPIIQSKCIVCHVHGGVRGTICGIAAPIPQGCVPSFQIF